MSTYGIIYKATNKVNSKCYIGQTIKQRAVRDLHSYARYRYSKKGHNPHLTNALKKYGVDGFDWDILCKCNNRIELNQCEMFFIDLWQTTNPEFGYNKTTGGSHPNVTEESRKRQQQARKRVLARPGMRKRMSELALIAQNRPETKANQARANERQDVKKRRSLAMQAVARRPETIIKRRKSAIQASKDPSVIEKRSKALKQALSNPLVRQKMQSAKIGRKRIYHPELMIERRVWPSEIQVFLEQGFKMGGKPKKC